MIKDQSEIRRTRETLLGIVRMNSAVDRVSQHDAERCMSMHERRMRLTSPEFHEKFPGVHVDIDNYYPLDLRLKDLRDSGPLTGMLPGADFSMSVMDGQIFTAATLDHARFPISSLRGANFELAILNGADFMFADLEGADLTKAKLKYTCFRYANLRNARIADCTLVHCDFRGADLTGAVFAGSQAVSCSVAGAVGADFGIQPPWHDCITEDYVL